MADWTGVARTLANVRAFVAHRVTHPRTPYYLLIGATLLLVVLGLLEVFSASTVNDLMFGLPELSTFDRQLVAALIGLGLMLLAARLPPRAYRALAYPLLFATILLLMLVLVIGRENNGNQNWLVFGGLTIQPSEFAKLALVLWGADLLVRKEKLLTSWKHLLVPLLPGGALVIGLVMLGGDMGTSVIIVAIVLALLWTTGAPARLFGTTLVTSTMLALLAVAVRPSRARRFTGFLNPAADPQGSGYQALHSFGALSSGGLFGVGLGASRAKWGGLPAAQTDFIFAIIGEELGLIGALTVLALFVAIGYAGFRIAMRDDDPFVRLVAAATTTWLMVQAVINLGAVLGVLPIAGVPLPFVSYGGSSLLPSMFAVGMLLSFARRRRRPKDADGGAPAHTRGTEATGTGMLPASRLSRREAVSVTLTRVASRPASRDRGIAGGGQRSDSAGRGTREHGG